MRALKLSTFAFLLSCIIQAVAAQQNGLTRQQYEEDFDYFWQSILDDYAYFDQKQTDWHKVRQIYRPQLSAVQTPADFKALLESVLEELYDFHTHLNTDTGTSPRLVPSGTEIWAEWIRGKPVITEVRSESGAEKAGVRTGMQVASINAFAIDEAVRRRMGKSRRLLQFARLCKANLGRYNPSRIRPLARLLMVLLRLPWKENPPQVLKK